MTSSSNKREGNFDILENVKHPKRPSSSRTQAVGTDATIGDDLHGEGNIIEFSYSELEQATSDFHESNIIGKGGFGAVYRGIVRGVERAIKVLHKQDDASQLKAYENEVKVLSTVKHPNIVRLIGTCPEKFVVAYELMSGGNLDKHLLHLHWKERLRIATEICSVLSYIHNLRPEILVHGDLKPENILLDTDRTSKLCDFGISRLILVNIEKITIHHSTDVKGTWGYLDPAFVQTCHLAPSSDVYSFGMVLLHLLTNIRVGCGLITVVEDAIDEQRLRNLLCHKARWPYQLAEELSKIALHCCNPRPKRRPDLNQVCEQLEEMKQKYHEEPIHSGWGNFQYMMDCGPQYFLRRQDSGDKLRTDIFSYTELEQATSCFSGSNVLRIDDFGKVYKGNLRDTEVAIMLPTNLTDKYQQRAFLREVNMLSTLEHPNLVHLIGACPEKFAFVYEFMSETLDNRLDRKDLLWKDRLHIATQVCSALVYLHSLRPYSVVHGDVKPGNVLLDANGVSKLDGIWKSQKPLPRHRRLTTTYLATEVQLKQNYQDPAFLQSGKLEPSADVYSFGMVLLRLLTKGRVGYGLIAIVEDALEEQNLEDLLDDSANWPHQLAEQLCMLALRCCNPRPRRRPYTAEVLENLEQMKKEHLTSSLIINPSVQS